jgi:hypothetical protein
MSSESSSTLTEGLKLFRAGAKGLISALLLMTDVRRNSH